MCIINTVIRHTHTHVVWFYLLNTPWLLCTQSWLQCVWWWEQNSNKMLMFHELRNGYCVRKHFTLHGWGHQRKAHRLVKWMELVLCQLLPTEHFILCQISIVLIIILVAVSAWTIQIVNNCEAIKTGDWEKKTLQLQVVNSWGCHLNEWYVCLCALIQLKPQKCTT